MSKIIFTKKQVEELENNKNILSVSERSITYTHEFKIHFIDEHIAGKGTKDIFFDNGLSIEVLGKVRIEQAACCWKRAYSKDGIIGLCDTRKTASGCPLAKELTKEEIINRQEAKILLLESQVELLKKSDSAERLLINKNKKLRSCEIFKLINDTIDTNRFKNLTGYFCGVLGVSHSGYYNYINSEDSRINKENMDLNAKDIILKTFNRHGFEKGSRSIKMILKNEFNINYSIKKIRRIMNKYDIVCPHRKANPYKRIAKATKEHSVVPNILNRNFKQGVPGTVLLTDITYLPYNGGDMAYLSTILDASTGEILAYNISKRITLDIATDTILKLKQQRKVKLSKDAFIHSDYAEKNIIPKF